MTPLMEPQATRQQQLLVLDPTQSLPIVGAQVTRRTGTANVKTGDANATGNSATNNTQQTVVQGHNGAVVIVDQDATITNVGIGYREHGRQHRNRQHVHKQRWRSPDGNVWTWRDW